MKIQWLVLLTIIFSNAAFAQKNITVIYVSHGIDSLSINTHLLAMNDSVSFTTRVPNGIRSKQNKQTIGNGFESHNTYCNRKTGLVIFQSEPYGKRKYLVTDTLKTIAWQFAEGEKEILGYKCKKAAAQDGNATLVAWYTRDIPVSIGPYHAGGLPGLILEFKNVSFHRTDKAVEVSFSAPKIIQPTKGKEISATQFRKILDEFKK